ncbi:MAG: T9SS type A sorting domain-containing protein [Saprospiraceae bacterium]|nr:T9SS type A sorting domain-containing protein [Saprospiraceae bacterium]MCF8252177.1 T9SS type A sorting domain-containing protein [Saprospiraceae bacterium]MCF8281570.1 T9SS type A sorting domain-containing protein [Bacteroidales bacterium]MCF8313846.1 T9SS type A sorting domain-containing protein [Saprospiraceae bacterium]MCF8442562.1 T9SS type A sorting domain-containing protein [Saprospiraceae bacterium]
MKKSLPVLVLLTIAASLSAQITVTNATFPAAGDTLWLNIDNSPGSIGSLTPPGPQNWDFTGLSADATQTIDYRPASEGSVGAQLPSASLFASPAPFTEEYYNVSATEVALSASYGPDPFGIGINAIIHDNPPLSERRAPLNFFDINQSSSGSLEGWQTATLPTLFVSSLPITSDSMRIRVAINRLETVEAYGSLSIPGGMYDVLRVKRTEYRENRIDAKVPPLGWLDVTDIVVQNVAGANFGVDTTYSYLFYNDVEKGPIAIVTLDNNGAFATQIKYKDTSPPVVGAAAEETAMNPTVHVSPNPASNEVVFDFKNLAPSQYRLAIFDENGRLTMEKRVQMNSIHSERFNLSGHSPGVYFLSVFDENGRVVCREKLVKK